MYIAPYLIYTISIMLKLCHFVWWTWHLIGFWLAGHESVHLVADTLNSSNAKRIVFSQVTVSVKLSICDFERFGNTYVHTYILCMLYITHGLYILYILYTMYALYILHNTYNVYCSYCIYCTIHTIHTVPSTQTVPYHTVVYTCCCLCF